MSNPFRHCPGRRGGVVCWETADNADGAPPLPGALVLPEIFVGRESTLAQMHQWLTTALQGKRHVEIIAGEPGIGKTALINTFVAQVIAGEAPMLGHGQCVELYGAGEP